MKLDPTALDAAAREVASDIYAVEWDELAPWQKEAGLHDAAAAITAYLTAVAESANAAAPPVDTTEFEAALQAFARDVEVYGCIWYADDVVDVPVVASRATVVDLYVKAVAR